MSGSSQWTGHAKKNTPRDSRPRVPIDRGHLAGNKGVFATQVTSEVEGAIEDFDFLG